jgi:hypothetical protein
MDHEDNLRRVTIMMGKKPPNSSTQQPSTPGKKLNIVSTPASPRNGNNAQQSPPTPVSPNAFPLSSSAGSSPTGRPSSTSGVDLCPFNGCTIRGSRRFNGFCVTHASTPMAIAATPKKQSCLVHGCMHAGLSKYKGFCMLHNARARVIDTPLAKKGGVFDMIPDDDADDDFEIEDFLIDASDMVTHALYFV